MSAANGSTRGKCDSCSLPWDVVLRHVPLQDGNWICLCCLQHESVQRQYLGRLAITLKNPPLGDTARRSQRPCALGRLCLNANGKKAALALHRQRYCSDACRGRAEFYQQHPEKMGAARMVAV